MLVPGSTHEHSRKSSSQVLALLERFSCEGPVIASRKFLQMPMMSLAKIGKSHELVRLKCNFFQKIFEYIFHIQESYSKPENIKILICSQKLPPHDNIFYYIKHMVNTTTLKKMCSINKEKSVNSYSCLFPSCDKTTQMFMPYPFQCF